MPLWKIRQRAYFIVPAVPSMILRLAPRTGRPNWETNYKPSFHRRRLAVLATQHEGKPYASLVAFAATDDLKTIIFATTRSTRKFVYLSSNPAVALLIDNRTNEAF